MHPFSKNQIDKLGDRLRSGDISQDDLRTLNAYRRSFDDAHTEMMRAIRSAGVKAHGRMKTNASIIDKLKRQSIRLSQIQDIAGCRVVTSDINAQEAFLRTALNFFPQAHVDDKRTAPVFGYRAIHVIVNLHGFFVELQIRSASQHFWAQLSEKLSDRLDPFLKYGGGPQDIQKFLLEFSEQIADVEEALRDKSGEEDGLMIQDSGDRDGFHAILETTMPELRTALAKTGVSLDPDSKAG